MFMHVNFWVCSNLDYYLQNRINLDYYLQNRIWQRGKRDKPMIQPDVTYVSQVRIIWRAGASLPSRTTGAIFRYIYIYIYGRALHIPYISKCFYVNFFKRNHRVQRSTSISSLAPARQQCPAFA